MFKSKKAMIILVLGIVIGLSMYFISKRYNKQYTSEFIDKEIYSSVLAETRKVFIRLPKHFDANTSYPLIIKSDGNFNLKRWHKTLVNFSDKNLAQDAILVAIPNLIWPDTRNRDLVPPYARKDVNIQARPAEQSDPELFGKADLFLKFIETELLPFIENKYKINNNRVLTGFSAGGSFVLYAMVTQPDLFTGYYAFSPAAWSDDSVVVNEFKHNLYKMSGKPKYFYLSIGGNENDIITGSFNGLLNALKHHAPNHLIWEYSVSDNAGHSENPYVSVPKALKGYHQFLQAN